MLVGLSSNIRRIIMDISITVSGTREEIGLAFRGLGESLLGSPTLSLPLRALGSRADEGDQSAQRQLSAIAREAGIDPDDYETWVEVSEEISGRQERGDWTAETLEAMWKSITDGARQALLAIAERPEGIDREELMAKVGAPTGSHLAGNLASIGFAYSRLKMRERPYETDGSAYSMDREIAQTILRLARGGGSE
jgi:hypothetical protein